MILWERGTLGTHERFALWEIAASALDFTNSYQVTGIFSGMHTGGEVIDNNPSLIALRFVQPVFWLSERLINLLSWF